MSHPNRSQMCLFMTDCRTFQNKKCKYFADEKVSRKFCPIGISCEKQEITSVCVCQWQFLCHTSQQTSSFLLLGSSSSRVDVYGRAGRGSTYQCQGFSVQMLMLGLWNTPVLVLLRRSCFTWSGGGDAPQHSKVERWGASGFAPHRLGCRC